MSRRRRRRSSVGKRMRRRWSCGSIRAAAVSRQRGAERAEVAYRRHWPHSWPGCEEGGTGSLGHIVASSSHSLDTVTVRKEDWLGGDSDRDRDQLQPETSQSREI